MLPSTSKTILSTSDDPTRSQHQARSHSVLSIDVSSDDSFDPPATARNAQKSASKKPAKSRLGVRSAGPIFDFSGSWWLDPEIVPHSSMRIQISKEINSYKKKFTKLEYGIVKKDEELHQLRAQQTSTLDNIRNETERVLAKQRSRIVELENLNANLLRKNKRKSKKVKRLQNMFLDESESSD